MISNRPEGEAMRPVTLVLTAFIAVVPACWSQEGEETESPATPGETPEKPRTVPVKVKTAPAEEMLPPIRTRAAVRGPDGRTVILFTEPAVAGEYAGGFTFVKVAAKAETFDGTAVQELRSEDTVVGIGLQAPGFSFDPKREYVVNLSDDFTYSGRKLDREFFVLEMPGAVEINKVSDRAFELTYNVMADIRKPVVRRNGAPLKEFEEFKLTVGSYRMPKGAGGEVSVRVELYEIPRSRDVYAVELKDLSGNTVVTELKGFWGEYAEDKEDRLEFTSEVSVSKQKDEPGFFRFDVAGRYEFGGEGFYYFPQANVKTASALIGNPDYMSFGGGVKFVLKLSDKSHIYAENVGRTESDNRWRRVNVVGDVSAVYYDERLNYAGPRFSTVFKPKAGIETGYKIRKPTPESRAVFRPKAESNLKLKLRLRRDIAVISKANFQFRYPFTSEIDVDEIGADGTVKTFAKKAKVYLKAKAGFEFFDFYIISFDFELGELPPTYNTVRKYGLSYSVDF
jgi:hypothetical protein